jgi:hypothetical protein
VRTTERSGTLNLQVGELVEVRSEVGGDEAHAAHVGGESVYVVHAPGRLQALVPATQIPQLELVGVNRRVLRIFEIDPAYPAATLLEIGDEVVADEPSGAGDQHTGRLIRHGATPSGCGPAAVGYLSSPGELPRVSDADASVPVTTSADRYCRRAGCNRIPRKSSGFT